MKIDWGLVDKILSKETNDLVTEHLAKALYQIRVEAERLLLLDDSDFASLELYEMAYLEGVYNLLEFIVGGNSDGDI